MQQVQTQRLGLGNRLEQYKWKSDEEEMIRSLMAAAMNHHAKSRNGIKHRILDIFRGAELKRLITG